MDEHLMEDQCQMGFLATWGLAYAVHRACFDHFEL
jgi:hypothetical protein